VKKKELRDAYFPILQIRTKNLGDKVEIRVRDNGKGIPQEIIDKVFNPFFTTKPAGQGTGLGLSLSYDIVVQEHRGEMKVESEVGEFAEFIIIIPKI
jgi:signal transduction histidine kinase